ncbi:MAG: flippase [bacterium]|nr:flippase [bacterium]
MSLLGKNTFQLTLASVGQKTLAFFYFLLLARTVGAESTGAYFLALSITTIFSVITDFGLQPVLIREVAKKSSTWQDIVRNTISLKMILMTIATVAVFLFVNLMGYDTDVRLLSYVAISVMLVDAVTLTMYGVLRGEQILKFESIGMFIGQALTVTMGVIVLFTNASLVLLVLALLLGSTFNAIFSTLMVLRRFGRSILIPVWSHSVIKPLLRVALPFALAGIFVKVYSYVDTITISKFFGEYEVGIYAVAYKLTYAFQFLPLAFVAALYPAMSALVKTDRDKLSDTFEQAMVYVTLLAAPIVFGIWAISHSLIVMAVGPEFLDSVLPLSILIFALFFIFLDFPIGSLLNAADRQVTKTTLMGITMVINVIANLLLIPRFGVVGAAVAANISFAFLFISGMFFVPSIIKVRWRLLISKIFKISFAGLIMGLLVRWADDSLNLFYTIPLGAMVYILMLILFRIFGKTEYTHIKTLISRHPVTDSVIVDDAL